MIQFPRYLPDQNALAVPGVPTPFPAGSLVAAQQGNLLAVVSPVDGTPICQWLGFDQWVMPDGSSFQDVASAFAFLDATCRKKRPLGVSYPFASATRIEIAHGMGFYPNVIIVDTAGDPGLADPHYPDIDTVVVTFSAPASGTAYLS